MEYYIQPCNHITSRCWHEQGTKNYFCGVCGIEAKLFKDMIPYDWKLKLKRKFGLLTVQENSKN